MRKWIDILEKWHGTFDRDDGKGYYDMHLNPSKTEFWKMMTNDPHKELRGILTATDIYVFPASADIHINALDHLRMGYDVDTARIIMDRNGPFINRFDPIADSEDTDPLVTKGRDLAIRFATNHPMLQRYYGSRYQLETR